MEINNLVLNYSVRKSTKIAKIIEPLTIISGIHGFFHYTISPKGLFTYIGSHPAWCEEYFGEKYYLNNPFLCHPSGLREGVHFPNTARDEQYLEMLQLRKKRIDSDHAMLLVNKAQGSAEVFGFFTSTENSHVYNFYANERPLLLSFINYFKEEMIDDLNAMKISPANIAKAKKNLFFQNGNNHFIEPTKRLAFLKALGKNVDWLGSLKFTQREKEVLRYLKTGRTALEIASALFISGRTVEKYLENIKRKLCCERRSEIFERLSELDSIGFSDGVDKVDNNPHSVNC